MKPNEEIIGEILKVIDLYCMKIQHVMKIEEIVRIALKAKDEQAKKEKLEMLDRFPIPEKGLNNHNWEEFMGRVDVWKWEERVKILPYLT